MKARPALCRALIAQASLLNRDQRGKEAGSFLEQAIQIAQETKAPGLAALSLREEGVRLATEKAQMGARQALEESIERFQEIGHRVEARRSKAVLDRIRGKKGTRRRPRD